MENIFDEPEENYFHRFSIMIIVLFVYYAITYYGLLKYHLKCLNLPDFTTIIILIIFHLIQVIAIKKLHSDEQWIWVWVLIILPVFLYIIILRYYDYMRKNQADKLNLMLYQMQQQNQPIVPSNVQFQPQQNTTPPMPQFPAQMPTNPLMQQQMMANQSASNMMDMPAYGDYVSQYNSINQPMMNMAQPFGNSFNPYAENYSPFNPF